MSGGRIFCYCFEIPLKEARADPGGSIETIRRRIAAAGCWCERLNPSGECCLAETQRLESRGGARGPAE